MVSPTLALRLSSPSGVQVRVPISEDAASIRQTAQALREHSPLSLNRAPSLQEVLAEYQRFIRSAPAARYGFIPEMEDLVLLSASSRFSGAPAVQLEFLRELPASWVNPPPAYRSRKEWLQDFARRAEQVDFLHDLVETHARRLGVSHIRDVSTSRLMPDMPLGEGFSGTRWTGISTAPTIGV